MTLVHVYISLFIIEPLAAGRRRLGAEFCGRLRAASISARLSADRRRSAVFGRTLAVIVIDVCRQSSVAARSSPVERR